MRRGLVLGLACGLALGLAAPVRAQALAEPSADALVARLTAGAAARPADAAARAQDWELFALACALEAGGRTDRAASFWRYLRTYFPRSPLAAFAPQDVADAAPLDIFDPDPDLSRLLNAMRRRLGESPGPDAEEAADLRELLDLAADSSAVLPASEPLEAFLARRPESSWAGWAAYQLLWRTRLESPDRAGRAAASRFALGHRGHPLADEAAELQDLRWVSPRRLALASALIPGVSEEILEPGARESAGALYAEALYLAGAIAFTVGAQSGARVPNLTGALILYNLVLLNHSGSSARAYEAGWRANLGSRRRFVSERLARPVRGDGHFEAPAAGAPADEPAADAWVLGLGYRASGPGDALRGRGWLREDQLGNLSLRLEYQRSLWDAARGEGWVLAFGGAPYLRGFANHAAPAGESPLARGLDVAEYGAGIEAAGWLRVEQEASWLALRISAGPGFRRRTADASGEGFADAGPVLSGAVTLIFGAPGGAFWQVGAAAERAAAPTAWTVRGVDLASPAWGWEGFSGLGVRF